MLVITKNNRQIDFCMGKANLVLKGASSGDRQGTVKFICSILVVNKSRCLHDRPKNG